MWTIGFALIHQHELFRVAKGQRLQQNSAHHREQSYIRANTQRDHHHGHQGKSWCAPQGAQSITQIAQEGLKPIPRPDSMGLFANQSRVAEGTLRRITSFFRGQAFFALLFFFQFEVGLQLALQVCIPSS